MYLSKRRANMILKLSQYYGKANMDLALDTQTLPVDLPPSYLSKNKFNNSTFNELLLNQETNLY